MRVANIYITVKQYFSMPTKNTSEEISINAEQFAKFVRHRPDLTHHYRYISPGGHIKEGYYRRKAKDEKNRLARKPAKLKTQEAFGTSAYNSYGERGLPEGIPVAASAVRKEMRGKSFKEPAWKKAIRELTESLKEIVEAVEIKKEAK